MFFLLKIIADPAPSELVLTVTWGASWSSLLGYSKESQVSKNVKHLSRSNWNPYSHSGLYIPYAVSILKKKKKTKKFVLQLILGTSLVVQWLKSYAPNAGVLSLTPDQGIRSHVLQLRAQRPQWRSNIPCAITKTWSSQINLKNK